MTISNSPFFSVILPTYNRAHIITETISSVINQTYSNWELIIVDDGSTDKTKDYIAKLQKEDERIKYIFQNNSERSAARNNGIKNSSGEWVCFLDSDDSFKAQHLSNFYKKIKENENKKKNIGFYVTAQENVFHKTRTKTIQKNKTIKNIPLLFASSSIVPGRVCIKKEILNKYKFDESIVIVEDADLWFRISCKTEVDFIDEATFQYHIHEDNSINVKNNAYKNRLEGLKKTFKKPEKKNLSSKQIRHILNNCYFGLHRFYINRNEISKARLSIAKAIFLYPDCRLKEKLFLFIYPKNIVS